MIFAALLTGGCGLSSPPPVPDLPPAPSYEGKTLEPGERVVFEFEVDGEWYPSDVLVAKGQRLRIAPAGRAEVLPINVIQFRIGTRNFVISDQNEFVVSTPGQIFFRMEPRDAPGFEGPVEVEIERDMHDAFSPGR